MIWIGAMLFVAMGVTLIVTREPVARGLALTLGGRIGAGCVIAVALALFAIAVLVVLLRDQIA